MHPTRPARQFRAPGRLNIIGEHVDYCGGLVLPAAIDRGCTVSAACNDDQMLRVTSPFGKAELGWRSFSRSGDWRDYVGGMAFVLARELGPGARKGLDISIASDVPVGAGLSSSAALELGIALALWHHWSKAPPDRHLLVQLANEVENVFVGAPCGVMDQYASAFGRAGHALLVDCAAMDHTDVPLPQEAAFVIIDTGVRHTNATSAYGERRRDCETATARLGAASLRDIADGQGLAALSVLDGNPARRARHVVSEIGRTRAAVQALLAADLSALGALMNQSHASLRDDMEVSCPELDRVQAIAVATPGVLGARMMGGGFGGTVIALAHRQDAARAGADAARAWARETGTDHGFHVCTASDGARACPA
jgi:galactokinase